MGEPEQRWVLPAEPTPVRLMNTIWADRHGMHDDLERPPDLAAWLASVGPAPPLRTSKEDLVSARRLRDALRRLAAHVTSDTLAQAEVPDLSLDEAIAELNETTRIYAPTPQLRLVGGRIEVDPHPGAPRLGAALASVALEAAELLAVDPTPLRACPAPGCVLYFVKEHALTSSRSTP